MTFNRELFITGVIVGFTLAIVVGFITGIANAHPPCEEQQQQITCGYVQVVNPTTGKLEQHYVCQ